VDTSGIAYGVEGGVATLRMERERSNAINGGTIEALTEAFGRAAEDPEVRAVLLRSGRKLFSPGLDLATLFAYDRPTMRAFMEAFSTWVLALVDFPKPVVAAIGGHAIAGGLVLALTADWRILQEGAEIGLNEVKIGIPLPFGVTCLLQDAVPPHRQAEVGLLGRNFAGQEALAAGLVHEVARAEAFEAVCRERAEEFAGKDPEAFAATKRYLRAGTAEALRAADLLYMDEWLDCWFAPPARRRIEEIVTSLQARRA
jgi:enoyl-CoA hydratase/carnithine racemase